ncbi:MAG: rRNA pseudouridine synthase [Thermotoga sp.]|nr:MAG: rRNA pseudouridine synthase [Thermotoga sp.]
MRLDKFLSDVTGRSRRESREIIRSGRLRVNGIIVKLPSYSVSTEDDISLDGRKLIWRKFTYIKMFKPAGYVSSKREKNLPTIYDLLDHPLKWKLSIAGRLDRDVEGLVILTNDGDLIHKIISPKHRIMKVYDVWMEDELPAESLKMMKRGFKLKDGYTILPVEILELEEKKVRIGLFEGKYHLIKRIFHSLNVRISKIRRIAIGNLKLDEWMKPGDWLEMDELEELIR